MKIPRAVIPLASLLIAILVAGSSAAQEVQLKTAGKPKTTIERPMHDFGEVKSGTPLKYSFTIKNTGDADLTINNVAPS